MAIGSHQSGKSKTNTWLTPPFILDALGHFDLDPASAPNMPWRTADTMWTKKDDGLSSDRHWFGDVWLNPPYATALIKKFMARMAEHGQGMALVFARTDTEWAEKYVFKAPSATGLMMLHGRLHFHDKNGVRAKANAGAPSMLVAYGAEMFDRLHASGLNGALLPLCPSASLFMVTNIDERQVPSWRELLTGILNEMGGRGSLQEVYTKVDRHFKSKGNPNWRAKVRQVINVVGERVGPSQYELKLAA